MRRPYACQRACDGNRASCRSLRRRFVFKEIDQRSADFLRALHLLNSCPCSSVAHFSYLLEVLTGDNRLVRIGKDDPFLAVDMLIPDALVDGVQRPSENGISDVMGIIQNSSE